MARRAGSARDRFVGIADRGDVSGAEPDGAAGRAARAIVHAGADERSWIHLTVKIIPNLRVRAEVRDHGPGFTPDVPERVDDEYGLGTSALEVHGTVEERLQQVLRVLDVR